MVKHQEERDKEDSRILEKALAGLAVDHRDKLSGLERQLKGDEKKKRDAFEQERVRRSIRSTRITSTQAGTQCYLMSPCALRPNSLRLLLIVTLLRFALDVI